MIMNTTSFNFDLIEVTNELPLNRVGGVGSVIENLASGFSALDVLVLWYLVDHSYRDDEIRYLLETYPNVVIGNYQELQYFDAPVVHLHIYNNAPVVFSYLKNKKTIYTIHSLLICEAWSNDTDMSDGIKQQEHMIVNSDEIVLVSKAELEAYYHYGYQALNANVRVIYNGLKQTPEPNYGRIRKSTIGLCTRLVPRKRPEYVYRLVSEDEFNNCSVMIAGRGYSAYVKNMLRQKDPDDRIRFLGWCGGARLESFYSALDVLAIPSIYEPFGMVALEAAARGIPVVCNPVGGLVEILAENAFYSTGTTYEEFRNAIQKWLKSDATTIRKKTLGAYRRFNENFTDKKMASEYISLVGELCRS